MSALIDTLTGYVDQLTTSGIRATLDPRSANPPCLLLIPPTMALDVSCGGTATFLAYAITRGPGNLDAWKSLDTLVASAATVLPLESFEPGSYALDDGTPLPAFILTWTEALTWP
jgi:hypothetical protein